MEIKHMMLFALLLVPFVSADGGNLTARYLDASAQQVKCKTDFMTGVISGITSSVPSASSLTTYADKLQGDESQLESYAAAGSADSYRDYLRGTYDPDLKSAREAIIQWRVSAIGSLNASERQAIRSSYSSLRSVFDSCEMNAIKGYAQAKVDGYDQILSVAQDRASNLSAKGIDASGLTSLISQARNAIVASLQSAIDSASDGKSLATAVRSYCLYNGCKDGTNFHFAAKWEIAKLTAIEAHVQAQPKAANYSSQLSQVTGDLNTAGSQLSSKGTSDYAPGQESQVWDPIKDAAKTLTEVIHGMRS